MEDNENQRLIILSSKSNGREMASQYLYGFIETDHDENFGNIGIGNKNMVTTIRYRDIAAVVSEHSVIQFDQLPESKLKSFIQHHQVVNERVMEKYTIIPLRFGNIAQNKADVLKILKQAYIQFKIQLEEVKGKIELVIQASANKQRWLKEIVDTNETIRRLTRKLEKSSAQEKNSIQIEVGKIIHDNIMKKENDIVADILATLKNGRNPYKLDKLLAEAMILNVSFLIDKSEESTFDQKLNDLGQCYADELNFTYIGPLPPYSFTQLNLKTTDLSLITNARKVLNLPEKASKKEIKKAYRTMVSKYHPDKNGNGFQKFNEIQNAYRTLEVFCSNYRYSFDKKTINEIVLVDEH